jgi:hypothetical protein
MGDKFCRKGAVYLAARHLTGFTTRPGWTNLWSKGASCK